ncbi:MULTISPECIES: hypothetical protein [Aeromonas]|jgi:hypothetical protein|uniref:hypothetical protein n=3 Tax=Aeromonadaceae TaxID=84642 RepID=UPI000D38A60D|nr:MULTISPECIES: hypothetical protein [Aeromonas]MCF5861533.1 hypothetical protein [Aeromonas veronii]MCQ4111312.1 hypothetical protein [Aeromonas sp. JL9]PTT25782.1 hypothetical protein DBR30_14595 [Aeromonas sp. HMWF017]
MDILLVSNTPSANSGYVTIDGENTDFINFIHKEFTPPDGTYNEILWGIKNIAYKTSFIYAATVLYQAATSKKKLQIKEIPKAKGTKNHQRASLLLKSVIVPKKTVMEGEVEYNHEIFKGMFKLKEQFEQIIKNMDSDDSEIIVCDADSVANAFGLDNIDVGIYTIDNSNIPIKLSNYSQCMWENVKDGIIKTFLNLNANRIYISDKTEASVGAELAISKEVISLAPKLGLNLKRKDIFSFDMKLHGVFDVERASASLYKITAFPELKALAEHIIKNNNSGQSYEGTAFLDVTFGANLNLITIFQGAFSSGYSRELQIKIEFS